MTYAAAGFFREVLTSQHDGDDQKLEQESEHKDPEDCPAVFGVI